ncbi:D-alanyl-D-alanine carboxypeptidase/D-alanyl-D-alanine endopeptidase [Pseudomonas matsuisoli]|uniref:D-alanyl-D-alanine carboxypeptidase n=1 Tax=Pseudomonas matsuisoli TaxID=1515666 RepID=A0A917PSU5_9PSED|nr:D-alanyl-D-alanine carboxypeptidase/D-alanyl-D-alanine-endopeptidase [Pseudomonas matsuisoli]GGJ89856.1 D-alanyl-D-alanine carboxypeptidase [Pseudomonas matsuisoli]
MKRLLLLVIAGLLPLSAPAQTSTSNATLPESVQQMLKSAKIGNDALSVVTLPLSAPGIETYINPDVSVNPASTMKLVTTFAALELLGPTYQWRTEFYTDGQVKNGVLHGNLYLKGGGDPKLNMERLWLLMRDLRNNGVSQVTGDLIMDRSYFKHPQLKPFNDDGDDPYKPYLVGPDSLLVNLKSVRMIARSEGGTVRVVSEPTLDGVRIESRITSLPAGKCSEYPEIRYSPVSGVEGVTVMATGKLAEGCNAQAYMALLDHPGYAAATVRAIWKELGGTLLGRNRLASVPSDARLLARAVSPDVVEIIRDINKYSNNTMAQQLFLSIGARYRTSADADDSKAAQRVIRDWLARKGITAPHLVLENGSGLSRDERISPREMALILRAAWRSPYAAEFISSLPLAGMDGTMRRRLRTTEMQGQAHIKTGTLNNVRAIAGFTRDRNGNSWAVVAILNHPRPWGAAATLDQVLLDVYREPKTGR